MGAISINLKGVSFDKGWEYLTEFQCANCHLFLSDQDIQEENYCFLFSDYANEIRKSELNELETYEACF